MFVCFCFISNFLELLLGNTFKYALIKSRKSWLKIGPNCTLLSATFLGNELALFPGHSWGKEEGEILVRLYIALAIYQADK